MRTTQSLLILLSFFLFAASNNPEQRCDPGAMIEACKKDLHPYSYSNSRSVMTEKPASREISVTLLSGESYRLVFNIAQLPEDAVIRIYNKAEGESGRNLLMSSMDVPPQRDRFTYEPPNEDGGDIYIDYEIPDPKGMACFTFVIGYQLAYLKD